MKNYHYGHRERLKTKFIRSGINGLANYELLELLLTYAIPRRDVKGIAKTLLHDFGSLSGVMTAPVEKLKNINGIGKNSAILLRSTFAIAMRCFGDMPPQMSAVCGQISLNNYLQKIVRDSHCEKSFILFFDKQSNLIGEWHGECTFQRLELLQLISLHHDASSIIIVRHMDTYKLSPCDLNMPFDVKMVIAAFNIELQDFLIVTPGKIFSLLK